MLVAVTDHAAERFRQRVRGTLDPKNEVIARVSRAYDAGRTIDAFATRLRQQVDPDALRAELLAVVDQTVQPVRVSLWLRPRA